MSIQTIERPTFAAQMGGNIGRSLAEQLPQEINRYRLSSGLKNLAKTSGNKSPIEQLAELQGIPGMTPELMGQVLPYLASQQESDLSKSLYGGGAIAPNAPRQGTSQEYFTGGTGRTQQGKNEFATSAKPIKYLQEPQPSDVARRANEIYDNGKRGITYTKAEKLADDELKSAYHNQQTNLTQTTTAFDNALARYGVSAGDVPPEIEQDFRIRAQNSVPSSSPVEAADRYARMLRDFKKQRNNLTAEGWTKWFKTNTKEGLQKVSALKNAYKDINQLDSFKNDLISRLNLSEPYADVLTYPVEKRITDVIPSDKRSLIQRALGKGESADDVFKSIGKRIDPSDSINSICVYLKQHGYDPTKFKEVLTQNFYDKLDDRQKLELSSVTQEYKPNLNDIWFGASKTLLQRVFKNG